MENRIFYYKNRELNLTSRPCTISDFPFVLDVYRKTVFINVSEFYEVDESILVNRFNNEHKEIFLIENSTEPVGFYQIKIVDNQAYITGFFIHPKFHKKGIGRDLMLSILSYVRDKSCNEVILHVWENNSALYFYKKIGFTVINLQNHKYLMSLKL